jgi:hypothetical protein
MTTTNRTSAEDVQRIMSMITGFWMSQVTRSAAEFLLAHRLAKGGRTSSSLADEIGSDPSATFRFLRACATLGLVDYREGRFFATPLLTLLDPDEPGSFWGTAMTMNMPGHWLPWGQLSDAIRRGGSQADKVLGADLWAYYKENPSEGAAFIHAVTNSDVNLEQRIQPLFDLGEASLVIDVGGAGGSILAGILRGNPQISGILFDLPDVVKETARHFPSDLADRCAFVGGDFLREIPSADVYVMRYILHDWADEQCLTILSNCRKAIRSGGRLFVLEQVISEIGAPDFAVFMDMNMLAVTNGQERSLGEYTRIMKAAGFKPQKVTPTTMPFSIIEAVPV